ncbi:MAG: hypothetical protein ACKOCD_03055 [Nitrospiraceae bacterium]
MKPAITKVATVPRTRLVCCPECYQIVSYDPLRSLVHCHACGTAVFGSEGPAADASGALH